MATDIQSQLTGVSPQGVSINDSRRIFNFGERIAELAPEQSPFFSYLSKVAKKPTDDPVFKFLEKRHQWQRRNFDVVAEVISDALGSGNTGFNIATSKNLYVDCGYDKYGREQAAQQPNFLLLGQVVAIKVKYAANGTTYNKDAMAYFNVTAAPDLAPTDKAKLVLTFNKLFYVPTGTAGAAATAKGEITRTSSISADRLADVAKIKFLVDAVGQVVGTNWAEGTDDPAGWRDEIYSSEGYTQIFKTAVPMFSGPALATRYRGDANEDRRVYPDKLREH